MDARITLDCGSWECQRDLMNGIVECLYGFGVYNEIRALGECMYVLGCDMSLYGVLREIMAVQFPD